MLGQCLPQYGLAAVLVFIMTKRAEPTPTLVLLQRMRTQHGSSVGALSYQQSVLLVFLRHFGCTFCREAMADLATRREEFEASGVRLVLVHMTDNEVADSWFERYKLGGIDHVSDPACEFYQGFGIAKGNFHQLFGLHAWIRGFQAGVVQGHWVGMQQLGDGFQMPGAFSVHRGEVVDAFIHRLASDKPDYWKLLACCVEGLHPILEPAMSRRGGRLDDLPTLMAPPIGAQTTRLTLYLD